MARVKLTKAVVANLPTPEKAQAFTWDSVLKGFGVRVSHADVKTYVAHFKARGGKERRRDVPPDHSKIAMGSRPLASACFFRRPSALMRWTKPLM